MTNPPLKSARVRASSLIDELCRASQTVWIPILREWLELTGPRFDQKAMEAAADLLARAGADLYPRLHRDIEDLALPNARYLLAVIASRISAPAEALRDWQAFFEIYPTPSIEHRVLFARALADNGKPAEACSQLRLALDPPVPYKVFPRIHKLVENLRPSVSPVRPTCRIAILGSNTTQLLAPVLEALCLRDQIDAPVYQGLYGAATQEIVDPASGLHSFKPRIVFLLNSWRDLNLAGLSADENGLVEAVVSERRSIWAKLAADFGCHVVQTAYDYPGADSYGYLARSKPGGRFRVIDAINTALTEAAPSSVSILDTPALQRLTGIERWETPREWYMFKQHPGTEALPELAEEMMAHVRAVLGLTKKVLAVDLDNTLWKGIIGEDGINGICLGPGDALGEAHHDLQRYILELKQRGVVLAVCSKNNSEDARLPFEQHSHTVLRLDDFAVLEASWNDKAHGLRNIAEKLSLGLDSFVFLDDNPVEREWVRSQLPQVAVIEPGASAFDYINAIERRRLFFSLSLSAEDLERAQQYRVEAQRETFRRSAQSIEEFLTGLHLQPAFDSVGPANLARATQLINKTNQFNLTTRRYTEAEVEKVAANPSNWASVFRLSDRLGDYGQIGVILCSETGDAVWQVDIWVISCRALGRQIEKFMFNCLLEAAAARGIRSIRGIYRPTPRNHLVAAHYTDLGFRIISEEPDEIRYEYVCSGEPDAR